MPESEIATRATLDTRSPGNQKKLHSIKIIGVDRP